MADPSRSPDADARHDDGGTPRWVKVVVILVAIVALISVVVLLIGGNQSEHGPSRHAQSGAAAARAAL